MKIIAVASGKGVAGVFAELADRVVEHLAA